MGIHNQYDKNGVWILYNLANDAGQITNVADQHPDIIQKMKTAYEKYTIEVGAINPRGRRLPMLWLALHPLVASQLTTL